MAQLNSSFSMNDIETMIEAMTDWESLGNHEYHVMQMVKGHPMPDREDESWEFVKKIKEHFKKREQEIKDERTIRQEKAVFVKAKLMMLRQEKGKNKEVAVIINDEVTAAPVEKEIEIPLSGSERQRLELTEFYLRDLGVWDLYQKFLNEHGLSTPEGKVDANSNGIDENDEWFHGAAEE